MATNAAAVLAKWKRNAQNSAEDYKNGVRAVTVSPTAKAAQNVDKYARGVQDAVTSGKFVNACNAVTLQEWQQQTMEKGARNFATGISAISQSAAKRMADQQAFAEQVKQEVAAMPNTTEADAEARSIYAQRRMREYGKRAV